MAHHDPEHRRENARIARNSHLLRLTAHGRRAAVQPAIDGTLRKLEDQVDPDRVLDPEERARRVEFARRIEMARLSKLGVAARRAKAAARAGAA